MADELSEKISTVQHFISEQEFTTREMLVLIGFLQSQTYELIQKSILEVRDL